MSGFVKERQVPSDRVVKQREALLGAKPQLSTERLVYLQQAYEVSGGEPPVITRAKVFREFLDNRTIFIDDNPIVGTQTEHRVGFDAFPETSCKWMMKEVQISTSLGRAEITPQQRALIERAAQFWRDKCILSRTNRTWLAKNGKSANRDDIIKCGIWTEGAPHPRGRICVDYGKVLNRGLQGIAEEAQQELGRLPLGSLESQKRRDFLDAVVMSLEAMIRFARRYAYLARDMAKRESSPQRKAELEKIAETCEWVPANPARTFTEAIQSFWFVHLGNYLEHASQGITPGRFPQYMYPFYAECKEKGRLSQAQAVELLELLFIKMTALQFFYPGRYSDETMGSMFQNISLGGVNSAGEDATNELDFLLLEAQHRVRLIQPTLSVLYHDKLYEEFLFKAAELVRTGIGMPAFFNNDVMVQRHLGHGASVEDARNSCIVGCVESGFSHTQNSMWGGLFNMPKMLELALNNGRDPLTGRQLGPQTGDAGALQSYEQLHEAVRRQLQYFLPLFHEFEFTSHALCAEFLQVPFTSALVDDCIVSGKDITEGGSRYSMDGFSCVGMIDLADSMAAIRKLVFEEKSVTMKELLTALQADFRGSEQLGRRLVEAPKYGNDDDYVDSIAAHWYGIYFEEHQRHGRDHLGRMTRPPALSITTHFPFGARTGALPSGRRAGVPFADATVSPEPGKDVNGPTALLKSATKVIDTIRYASGQINIKLHPASLEGHDGLRKLIALTKTYMDLGGHHIQFNVVSAETLRDAQLHPENYESLIVRVAGFSAFFVHLNPAVQEEIIKRTELSL